MIRRTGVLKPVPGERIGKLGAKSLDIYKF
jgi:hypothetical protein